MEVSWTTVIFVDILGSILTVVIALWSILLSREWTNKKPDDIFRHYIFLLTLAFVFFAISRSFGHLVKQILLLNDMGSIWQQISPFSGAINSTAFVVIFAFGIFFHRFQKIHFEREKLIKELQKALDEIKSLRGILPVCCVCGLIRDDSGAEQGKGVWMKTEEFIVRKTDAQVSHGYCPECYDKAMTEI